MECTTVIDRLIEAEDSGNDLEFRRLSAHLAHCESCRDEWRGAQALRGVRRRPASEPRAGFFAEVIATSTRTPARGSGKKHFWAGTAVGGLLAACIAVAIVTLGIFDQQPPSASTPPVVTMALGDQQDVNIAIDAERDLTGTTINVTLSEGFEIAGFAGQRTLSWVADLDRGVNKLTLPVAALDTVDGELVVRLEHEGTTREFRLALKVAG